MGAQKYITVPRHNGNQPSCLGPELVRKNRKISEFELRTLTECRIAPAGNVVAKMRLKIFEIFTLSLQ
jgi:hypothetical protein